MNTGAYQYFQYLLHNRTITNENLYTMKISNTKICKSCQKETDTLKHAFLEFHTTVNTCMGSSGKLDKVKKNRHQ